MAGGRRKFRRCRSEETVLGAPQSLEFYGGVVLDKVGSSSGPSSLSKVETYVASTLALTKQDVRDGPGPSQSSPNHGTDIFFDPLLPRCRHDKSHAVSLRNLKKHEVRR